ncbi:hypothetical protein CBP21_03230 [Fischerella thermalis WC246]|nr:hypothetical protein CBP21_03230 [Fischerella thermalis WC246]
MLTFIYCSVCGTRVKKSLSTRTHKCHKCGTVMHRDHNAAKQILAKGIKNTVGHTQINDRWTEQPLSRWGNSSRQVDWLKQESHTFKVWECQFLPETATVYIQILVQCIYPASK